MSMISEQIKMLESVKDEIGRHHDEGWAWTAQVIDDAISTIQDLSAKLAAANMERSSAYYNGGWIPVGNRLPEITKMDMYSEDVLTTLKWYDGDITYSVGWYNKSGVWSEDCKNCKVIAWMPLPEPYRKEV